MFTWFAGYRMQFFAAQGLADADRRRLGQAIGSNYSDAFKKASTGDDGKKYFVPFYNYPWAVFYRKSVWQAKGYEVPKTFDDLKTLCAKMKTDGLDPDRLRRQGRLAGDGHVRPAQHAHERLRVPHRPDGAARSPGPTRRSRRLRHLGRACCRYHQTGALGRTWQEAAQNLASKKSGMYLLGTFVGPAVHRRPTSPTSTSSPFPEIDSQYGTDAVEAPIDGFMISKKAKNEAGAKELLKFLGSADAQNVYLTTDPSDVAANKQADTSGVQRACRRRPPSFIGSAKQISQFLDRDSNPTFASTVVIPAFQQFIKNPNDIDSILKNVDAQAKTIYAAGN